MSVLLVEPDERRRGQLVRMLESRRVRYSVAQRPEDAFPNGTDVGRPGLVLVGTGGDTTSGLEFCTEFRRRHVTDRHPQLVLVGPFGTPRQLLTAFESGVSDWVSAANARSLDLHLTLATRRLSENDELEPLPALRRLGPSVTGVFRCTAEQLDARVEVSRGRIGLVALQPNSGPLQRLVENEARRRVPEVRMWLRAQVQAPEDWRKALVEWGLWDRARLRDALAQHARQSLRLLASFRTAVTFEARPIEWSDELTFDPEEVLPEPGAPVSGSFTHGPHSFLRSLAANDVRMTEVS